jgi:hypothetical protein
MATNILTYPDYVGEGWSRSSSDTSVDNALRLPGTLALDIDRKLTPGKSYGSRALPQVRSRGKAEFSAKLTLLQLDYEQLCAFLIAKGAPLRQGLFEVSFQLTCTVFEPLIGTVRWDVLGARITSESTSPVKDGDDAIIQAALDLDVMNILKNGAGIVREQSPFGQIGV